MSHLVVLTAENVEEVAKLMGKPVDEVSKMQVEAEKRNQVLIIGTTAWGCKDGGPVHLGCYLTAACGCQILRM